MRTITTALSFLATATVTQAENRIDTVRPDAPALAHYGDHKVGVTTMTFTNADQVDVVNTGAEGEIARYDREMTVEVWYPAHVDTQAGGTLTALVRDGVTEATLTGQAARDADAATGQTYPLVIVSHGYPGNRFLMAPLAENLASKGYVVASIDHPDSTYDDQTAFGSTLVNRPWDQRFIIDQLGALEGDLGSIIDDDTVAIIGYSMGGYGALIYAGAGVTQASTEYSWGAPQGLLERNLMGSQSHAGLEDERVKAVVAFGPWGNNAGFWDADGLAGIDKPLMLIAGSVDDVSVYDAIRGIYDGATNTTRHLLTFENANHNAGAPMSAPVETYALPADEGGWFPFGHYSDAVWDTVKMNNISQHFIAGYLDLHLKGDADKAAYFDLIENGNDGVWSLDDAGEPADDHTYWHGFRPRSAFGLRFETAPANE